MLFQRLQKRPDNSPSSGYFQSMTTKFTYWKEPDGRFLGYLNDYPDHWTQGDSLQDLKDHLRDLHETFSADVISGIKKVEELELA